MKHNELISEMMTMNFQSRIWHWQTPQAQHHVSYEQFLTANEGLMDRFVESALGNDIKITFENIKLAVDVSGNYEVSSAKERIKAYRDSIAQNKSQLEGDNKAGSSELITILDDVTELCSKTLYLLKLS